MLSKEPFLLSKVNSLFNSITYCLGSTIIDPGDYWNGFKNIQTVLLTHAHLDHIYGLNRLIEINPGVRIYTNQSGKEMLIDSKKNLSLYHETPFVISRQDCIEVVKNHEEITVGNDIIAKAIFTPGHNPSCITWIVGDAIFTGDSYIPGIKTVVNLPDANKTQARLSEELIFKLSQNKSIYPGHKI